MSAAAVVLAAGAGRRHGGPSHKLTTPIRGKPLLSWAVVAALGASLTETVVVVGASHTEIEALLPGGLSVLVNPGWRTGMASSLQVALAHLEPLGVEAMVVGLGDQPFVTAEAWRRLAEYRDRPVGVATYGAQRGHPVRLAREVWPRVPTEGDEGMRTVMRFSPDLVGEVPCPGNGVDIDTTEDFDRWS